MAARTDVARLLDEIPTAIALVTSRQVLRLRSEQQFPSLPWPGRPRSTFAERAAAAQPGFTLDATTAPAVAEICRLLDRLPLAMEMAAARVRLLPPGALLARLRERLNTNRERLYPTSERQRTLRATMDWSYGLLMPHEQSVPPGSGSSRAGGRWTRRRPSAVAPGNPRCSTPCLRFSTPACSSPSRRPDPRRASTCWPRSGPTRWRSWPPRSTAWTPSNAAPNWIVAMTARIQEATGRGYRTWAERLDRRSQPRAAMQRAIEGDDVATVSLLIRNTSPTADGGTTSRRRRWRGSTKPCRGPRPPPAVRGRADPPPGSGGRPLPVTSPPPVRYPKAGP